MYLIITIPEPPVPPCPQQVNFPPPAPPPPVLTVPFIGPDSPGEASPPPPNPALAEQAGAIPGPQPAPPPPEKYLNASGGLVCP